MTHGKMWKVEVTALQRILEVETRDASVRYRWTPRSRAANIYAAGTWGIISHRQPRAMLIRSAVRS